MMSILLEGRVSMSSFFHIDTAYVTRMKRDFGADTWFVNLDRQEGWEETETGDEKEYEGLHFTFCTYKNRNCQDW